jgi:peptide-methionine (S)-S-oxide reductase
MTVMQQLTRWSRIRCATGSLILCTVAAIPAIAAPAAPLPAPMLDTPKSAGALQTAVLAGGCFWGVQGVFQHVQGVRGVLAGYAGGDESTAHYHLVSSGTTGHAESVEIKFDPQAISYGEILRIFFSVVHDPTELNRQGPDAGPQYRSEIFYLSESQAAIAHSYLSQLDKARIFRSPIVTRIEPMKGFYPAEAVHQDFIINYPDSPYVVVNDLPKIAALKTLFAEDYRDQPVRVTDRVIPITVDNARSNR